MSEGSWISWTSECAPLKLGWWSEMAGHIHTPCVQPDSEADSGALVAAISIH